MELVAMVVFPCPNRMLPVPSVTRETAGEVPPVEVRDPLAVTVRTGVVVAIILPFWSVAKKEEVLPVM